MKMKVNKNMKVTILAAVAALSIGAFGIVSATNMMNHSDDGNSQSLNQMQGERPEGPIPHNKKPGEHMQQRLTSLVKDGTITQQQADAIKAADEKLREQNKDKFEAKPENHEQELQSLASQTGISKNTLQEIAQRPERLASFVNEGKVTQAQADALTKALEAKRVAHDAERQTFKKNLASASGVSEEVINKVFTH